MASITTRAGKGSPLTNAELDANFVNINAELAVAAIIGGTIDGATIGATSPVTAVLTQLDVDNIQVSGNTILSTNTNGNINLSPNGTGVVAISAASITVPKTGDGGAMLAAVEIFDQVTVGQYIEIMWSPESGAVSLDTSAEQSSPFARPAIPSVILNVDRTA